MRSMAPTASAIQYPSEIIVRREPPPPQYLHKVADESHPQPIAGHTVRESYLPNFVHTTLKTSIST